MIYPIPVSERLPGPDDCRPQVAMTDPSPDFRAKCAELANDVRYLSECLRDPANGVDPVCLAKCKTHMGEAYAALSQPAPEPPARDDVFDLCEDHGFELSNPEESASILLEMFNAVLARWGQGNG